MKRPTILAFLFREKWLILFSVAIFIPLCSMFTLAMAHLLEMLAQGDEDETHFLLTRLYPFFAAVTVSLGITYLFAVQNQVREILQMFALVRQEGEQTKRLFLWIAALFALVFGIVLLAGAFLGLLDLWYVLPMAAVLGVALFFLGSLLYRRQDEEFLR